MLFLDEEISEDFRIPRGNPQVRELKLVEFLEELENSRGFPRPKITQGFPRGFFQ